ncbi:hypothetical protein MBLNU459_g4582t1 [Dothideomycetes sp. NU459]
MSQKRRRSISSDQSRTGQSGHGIWVSEKIEDRESIFQAYFSPTMPHKELQALSEIKSASHRMLGWRTPSAQRTLGANPRALMELGSDDDGEKYGGQRVRRVLEEMQVEGALVVARWYGGIMLGPIRFTHIEECAKEAVKLWKQQQESEALKKRKIEDEAKEKATLVRELQDRDESIKVLRGLLEQKTKPVKAQEKPESSSVATTAFKMEYGAMQIERLRQMDKARDGTIAFLLKKIDEVEKRPKSVETGGELTPNKDVADTPEQSRQIPEPNGSVAEKPTG